MDGKDIEARAVVLHATRVTVHDLCVLCYVVSLSSPQLLFPLYLADRRLDGVPEMRGILECRRRASHYGGRPGYEAVVSYPSASLAPLLSRIQLLRFPATNFRTF